MWADVFKCHPDSSLIRSGDLSSELERFVEALQIKSQYHLFAHAQRTPGFDKQAICANICYLIGVNAIICRVVDRNIA